MRTPGVNAATRRPCTTISTRVTRASGSLPASGTGSPAQLDVIVEPSAPAALTQGSHSMEISHEGPVPP
jgi:hypothetical protein